MKEDVRPDGSLEKQEYVPQDDTIITRVFVRSLVVFLFIGCAVGVILYLNRRSGSEETIKERSMTPPEVQERSQRIPTVRFVDITLEAGIDFVHENGATGDKLLPETMGGGCAFFDFDGDTDQDLLFVNSADWPDAPGSKQPATMALYENNGKGRFADVTKRFGLDVSFYGIGVAVGDYDNDDDVDVFISAVGENHLFRNDNDKFEEITTAAGVAGKSGEWSTGCGFFDYDNDDDLDLFVCNYVRWSRKIDLEINFQFSGIGRAYGPPTHFQGTQPYLYRNNGDGTFTDVSAAAGIEVTHPATGQPVAKALAIALFDVDGDGWMDIFLANDTVRNFFFHNLGDGTFAEEGSLTGLDYDPNGEATGAMGVDAGYFRNDTILGFGIGNFANEMTSLYVSQGDPLLYTDEAITEGIGAVTRSMLTFGLFFFDYDLDGRLDLLQANGHLEEKINVVQPSQHYKQPAQLFWNRGPEAENSFAAVDPAQVGDLSMPIVGRGASYADIDGDGDLDVLLTQVGDRPLLLRNDQALGHNWLRVRLIGTKSNRDGIGARLELISEDILQRRQVMPTRSYISQAELPVTFGLGKATTISVLRITWPDGAKQELNDLKINTLLTVRQPDA